MTKTKKIAMFAIPMLAVLMIVSTIGPAFAAPASTTTTSQVVPFALAVFVPCADGGSGEFISLTGNLHLLISVTINDKGSTIVIHANPQGLSGEGLTTGDSYQGVGVTRDVIHVDGATTTTFVNNFRMIGEGPGNNLQLHQTIHVTINPDGTTTSEVIISSIECF